jgi:DNA repair protein RadA
MALDKAIFLLPMDKEMEERKKRIQRISTGSMALDEILGGGVETDAITGLSGEYASGKSQLCFQLALNCIKQYGRSVAWIETEPQTFRPERVLEIAKYRGIPLDATRNIFVIPSRFIVDAYKQFNAYERVEKEIKNGLDIGMIIIDSFSAKFRDMFAGREMFPLRSQEQSRHLGFLQYLASKYNLAIVLTVQVMGVPDTSTQYQIQMKESDPFALYGGHILKHCVTFWLRLAQVSSAKKEWSATLFDAPNLPRREAKFKITERGIEDIETIRGKG